MEVKVLLRDSRSVSPTGNIDRGTWDKVTVLVICYILTHATICGACATTPGFVTYVIS